MRVDIITLRGLTTVRYESLAHLVGQLTDLSRQRRRLVRLYNNAFRLGIGGPDNCRTHESHRALGAEIRHMSEIESTLSNLSDNLAILAR